MTVAELLTTKVRCALGEQLYRYASESTIERMVEDGFLAKRSGLVRWPLLTLTEPLDAWLAGDPPSWRGDPEAISYRAQSRWWGRGARMRTVLVATPRLAKITGGVATGEIRSPLQLTHDIHLLECLALLSPAAIEAMEGEDYLRSTGWARRKKVPDAMTTIGDARFAIEFGGSYGKDRVAEFQDWAVSQNLSYVMF